MTDNSATVDGEDGTRIEAEATAGGTSAKLEFLRETVKFDRRGEVSYVFEKTHIRQHLTLIINDSESDDLRFLLAEQDEASSFDSHAVDVSPDGEVVAYRLGEQQWKFLHVLTPELVVHDDYEAKKLDWSKVPDPSGDGFVPLFLAQALRLDATHSFNKHVPMLEWLRETEGQRALAEQLYGLIPHELHNWHDHLKLLDEQGLERLRDMVRSKVAKGQPHSEYFAVASALGFADLESSPDLARRGAHALAANDNTLRNNGADLAEYLRVHARSDVSDAAVVACDVVGEKARLAPNGRPYATDYGRPLAMVSFAVLARAGADCGALDDWEADPCTVCGGRCSDDALEAEIERVLTTPVQKPSLGRTPDERDKVGGLIVAAAGRSCD